MSERLFKIIVIGDPAVGKTSLVRRYVSDSFKSEQKGTVGVDFALKILKWNDDHTLKLQFWDVAGQERFALMTRVYYKDANGCILMFDLTNKNSFANAVKWKVDVDLKCQTPDGKSIPTLLLANKSDLHSKREVEQMEIENFFREHDFIGWTEVSAKGGLMIEDSIRFLAEVMMKTFVRDIHVSVSPLEKAIQLTTPIQQPKKTCSC